MSSTQTINEYIPDYLVPPGEVLADYLESAGLTQALFAERTGLPIKTINGIIEAKSAITSETALKLECLGHPARFWDNLERQYQEDKERLADKIRLEEYSPWLKLFPITEMVKHKWVDKQKDKIKLLEVLLRFFGISSPEEWEIKWTHGLQTAFRKTEHSKEDIALISAWLRKGEIDAQNQQCAEVDRLKFQNSLMEIRKLTIIDDPNVFVPKLKAICAAAGVAVVFVPALRRLGIYGATRMFNNKYIIQLSLRGKSNDQLWFTFFHEVCHIINHPPEILYIEGDHKINEKMKENEADAFARDILIPTDKLSYFLASGSISSPYRIKNFATRIGVAPGIVVGRLQHDKKIRMSWGNNLRVFYKWNDAQV